MNIATLPQTEPTDEELMARIVAKDHTALALLHKKHYPTIHSVAVRILNNHHDAEDIANSVFSECWAKAESYSSAKGKPLGWLVTITKCRTIDFYRSRNARNAHYDRYQAEIVARWTSPVAPLTGKESYAIETLNTIMATLPPLQQQAVRTVLLEGKSHRQASEFLGSPLGTLKTRLELGMRKIYKALKEKNLKLEHLIS